LKKIFNEVLILPEFKKDFKRLEKNYPTLKQDLEVFVKNQLKLSHKLNIENSGIVRITGLSISEPKIYKARKFACKSLKGRGSSSGIRVIYAYFEDDDRIELVEIYFKGDKENEDRQRILKYYSDEK
jgi:mRNA-degrading endonuclease RelE of RelBE toxin-antitoxin system